MPTSRPAAAGLLLMVFLAVGCTAVSDEPRTVRAAAVTAYVAPDGAPAFCQTLAGSTGISGIPAAVGALAADTAIVEARLELTAGIGDLRAVLHEVRATEGHERLETALERLVTTLTAAASEPLTDPLRTALTADLDAVGRHAQAVCDFPA